MSSDAVISLRGAGKCYRLYDRPSDRLKQMVANRLPGAKRRTYYREHWALRGIDLEIDRGETVGIVGQNGSGKSTLLQLVCGTLTPSEGEIRVAGRIAPLLQLGAGFNPEFTGRENIGLNAAILGLTTQEIDARFDDIVGFAAIGDMLDQPVKLYSSGMYARLAFAVAINVDPEILIVDEALAVGDEAFQRKCFSRIEAIRKSGATVLFVSHASNIVAQLCNRAFLLHRGELLSHGHPRPVIMRHNQLCYAPSAHAEQIRRAILAEMHEHGPLATNAPPIEGAAKSSDQFSEETFRSSSSDDVINPPEKDHSLYDEALENSKETKVFPANGASILSCCVENIDGKKVNTLQPDGEFSIVMRIEFQAKVENVRFSWTLRTMSGMPVAGSAANSAADRCEQFVNGDLIMVRFPFRNIFNAGIFTIDIGIRGSAVDPDELVHGIAEALVIRTMERPKPRNGLVDCCIGDGWMIERSQHHDTDGGSE